MKELEKILKNHFEKFGTSKVNELSEGLLNLMLDYGDHTTQRTDYYPYKGSKEKISIANNWLKEKLEGIKTMTKKVKL